MMITTTLIKQIQEKQMKEINKGKSTLKNSVYTKT